MLYYNNLKIHRCLLGLDVETLAKLVQVSPGTIKSIEEGKYNPSVYLAIKITEIMGYTVEEIFKEDK